MSTRLKLYIFLTCCHGIEINKHPQHTHYFRQVARRHFVDDVRYAHYATKSIAINTKSFEVAKNMSKSPFST